MENKIFVATLAPRMECHETNGLNICHTISQFVVQTRSKMYNYNRNMFRIQSMDRTVHQYL